MERRELLCGVAAGGAVFAGCLDAARGGSEDDSTAPTDDGTGDESSTNGSGTETTGASTGGDCAAAVPLTDQLTDELSDDQYAVCSDDREPSLVVANEREEAATVVVEAGEDADGVEVGPLELAPGERSVDSRVVSAGAFDELTAIVDGESTTWALEQAGPICYRRGVVVTDDDVQIGNVEPLAGPGDAQHDCYAGDPAQITIYNGERSTVVELSITDRCGGRNREFELELEPEDVVRKREALTNGGIADVEVAVDDATASYRFDEECWGLEIGVVDGEPEIQPMAID